MVYVVIEKLDRPFQPRRRVTPEVHNTRVGAERHLEVLRSDMPGCLLQVAEIAWVVDKQWEGRPGTLQPATQQAYLTEERAEEVAAELRRDMPDRQFRLREVYSSSEGSN